MDQTSGLKKYTIALACKDILWMNISRSIHGIDKRIKASDMIDETRFLYRVLRLFLAPILPDLPPLVYTSARQENTTI